MFDLPKYGDGICLARMAELLDTLAVDRARLEKQSVAVTGSNGKGSTAAFCASIGRALGLRTGLFTSPHLFRVNERFQIDGTPIGDEPLQTLAQRVATAIADVAKRRGEQFGAFEAMFALACVYFQESDCDFLVFEAGIGGRYDPVRLLDSHVATVTSVDLEHVALLGNSLELIVSDKSDACASPGVIVYGENCLPLRPHILEYNRNRNVQSLFVGDEIKISRETAAASGSKFDFLFGQHEFRALEIALPGHFQINNAAIAIALVLRWLKSARPPVRDANRETAIRAGLRKARWPGRLERIADNPLTVVDVGHTPDGVKQALAGLMQGFGGEKWILVLGISHDKKADEIVRVLAPAFDVVICTSAHHKGSNVEALASLVRQFNPRADVTTAATIEAAFVESRTRANELGRRVYVAGGLFTAIEFAATARGQDAASLDFF